MLINCDRILETLAFTHNYKYVTRPRKTDLTYTKYTCSYYGTYLLFYLCYQKSVSFIEFFMDFCIYDDILDTIQFTDKK